MSTPATSSLQRVLTTLSHQEPDRVPLFLLLTMHGAKELDRSIKDYFLHAEYMVAGQLRMAEKYQNDCFYAFSYAALEVEAWGGEVIFRDDGPPNAGEPFIRKAEQILSLEVPNIQDIPGLRRMLETISQLHAHNQGQRPIIAVAIAPFSLPVMQMGFEAYLDLIHERPDLLERLLQINEEFCVAWANAQLAAGATAICYFNPLASTTMVTPEMFRQLDAPLSRRMCRRINGPVALHFASGRCLPLMDDLADLGAAVVGVSMQEDLHQLKQKAKGKFSLLGNLNGIAMRHWNPNQAEAEVKAAIAAAGPGGGFILSDNHGEIPFQVSDETLLAISASVREWGVYPLQWAAQES
ncbi:Uroporphyrinogen decarboxylase (URO-D) [Oscillochloris trichoides DG-6]|uniref:Uroporphyrinogen decarboxylase (URO-D) n=1 Tax=Oscillochloris trichoides DG-6 TaxID=765420 RepID=E1IFR5_9CHLR|nr:uroporphyrinogen decarboxylase family protein [Oscillochloris trichoides]EFO79956.1 Uroporphyrinogen decarboxylase (URO-D) [Oscillochloris trichoides DG-6]